jgi:hypothetical protein
MRQYPDKLYSDRVPAARIREAMESLPHAIDTLLGNCIVTAYYGFGTTIHPDLRYLPMEVAIGFLGEFISDSISQRIVEPGRCDFLLVGPDERITILYCHESDVHVGGKDDALIAQLVAMPQFSNMGFRPIANKTAGNSTDSTPNSTLQ